MMARQAQMPHKAGMPAALASFFKHFMTTEHHNDKYNPFNVGRWKQVVKESLAARNDERMWEALASIVGIAEDLGVGNSREAWRALSQIYVENRNGSMAARGLAHDALRSLLTCAHDEPEISKEVAKIFGDELNAGALPMQKLRNLNGVAKEALAMYDGIDDGNGKDAASAGFCRALVGIMRQEFEEMTMPSKLSMENMVTALGISGIRLQIAGLELQIAEMRGGSK